MDEKIKSLELELIQLNQFLENPKAYLENDFAAKSKRKAEVESILDLKNEISRAEQQIKDDEAIVSDPELGEMAKLEIQELTEKITDLTRQLDDKLIPRDPDDDKPVIMEIRAGAGGDEASLFAAELYRMYLRYAEKHGFKVELMNESLNETGGVKEVVFKMDGDTPFGTMKFEGGVHRVQRVPVTESQGRIHTSTVTVVALPEVEESEIVIDEKDLRIDIFHAGGHGGQSVNTTNSAIRITHLPTGIVVQCQNERSQHKNKERAIKMLKAKLYEIKEREHLERIQDIRGEMKDIGWGSQIRSYVMHPYSLVKDHRTNEETGNVDKVMDGYLDPFINAYLIWKSQKNIEK